MRFNEVYLKQGSTGISAPVTAGIRLFSPAPVKLFLKSRLRPRLIHPNPGPGLGFSEHFCRDLARLIFLLSCHFQLKDLKILI